jgi:hypothetical protein
MVLRYYLQDHINMVATFDCFKNISKIIKILKMKINIYNKIMVQTLNIILRLDICFEIRKKIHRKIDNFQSRWLYYICLQQTGKLVHFWLYMHPHSCGTSSYPNILHCELYAHLWAIQHTHHRPFTLHISIDELYNIYLLNDHIHHSSSQHNHLDKLLIITIIIHFHNIFHIVCIQK